MEERGGSRWTTRRLFGELPVFLFSALLVACESAQPQRQRLPEPIDAESAALGISVCMTETLGLLSKDTIEPDIVLFVRLEDGEELKDLSKKRVLIPSTFVRGDYAYLLNASPGKYVAVAALYGEDLGPTTVKLGTAKVGSHVTVTFHLELSSGKVVHRNYFSREMIEASTTTVAAGSFAFLGNFEADQAFRFGEADELQVHFLHVLEGEGVDRKELLADISSEGRAHRLSPRRREGPAWQSAVSGGAEKDRDAELAFCRQAKQALKGTAWVQRIDESMKAR